MWIRLLCVLCLSTLACDGATDDEDTDVLPVGPVLTHEAPSEVLEKVRRFRCGVCAGRRWRG